MYSEGLAYCLKKLDENLAVLGDSRFLAQCSKDNMYGSVENKGWTTGFFTGMIWLAYEVTGDEKYKTAGQKRTVSFSERLDNKVDIDHHDLGFLYSLSCVADYKLTGSVFAKNTAIRAAEKLIERFQPKGGFIQAWGALGVRENYRLIVDCLMNIPLLFWAAEATGDTKYAKIARTHLYTTLKYAVRDDFSSYHTFYFDPDTGAADRGVTHQGAADNSTWARGQAWVIYGCALARRYVGDDEIIRIFDGAADYFLKCLPEDKVCYWDLMFKSGNEERDSSAAAIAACGMLEMSRYAQSEKYKNAAYDMVNSLTNSYLSENTMSNGILLHGVYTKPGNVGVDECMLWGDYFYMEALTRQITDWKVYW